MSNNTQNLSEYTETMTLDRAQFVLGRIKEESPISTQSARLALSLERKIAAAKATRSTVIRVAWKN